jgi:ATP diphosphatase
MSHSINDLLHIMSRLRDPDAGCPWDVKQTFSTIAPYTIEEAYEVADAIERGDMEELRDELGDLLFQVVFHARMADEMQEFDFADVVDAICDKLVRRHPHVFGDAEFGSEEAVNAAWDEQKTRERERKAAQPISALDGVARSLPALMRAEKLQRRAARLGFDWRDTAGVMDKLREEIGELEAELASGESQAALQEELGDLLFTCVNLARHLGADAEQTLRDANGKFERRFRAMETMLAMEGNQMQETDMENLDQLWERAKQDV